MESAAAVLAPTKSPAANFDIASSKIDWLFSIEDDGILFGPQPMLAIQTSSKQQTDCTVERRKIGIDRGAFMILDGERRELQIVVADYFGTITRTKGTPDDDVDAVSDELGRTIAKGGVDT